MHERPRRFPDRVVDGALVAVVAFVGMFGLFGPVLLMGANPRRVSTAGIVLVLAQAAALWWRRGHPLPVLGATLATLLLAQANADPNAPSFIGVHVAAYSAGAYMPHPRAFVALSAMAAAAVVDVAAAQVVPAGRAYAVVAFGPFGIFALVAWIIGRYVAARRAYLDMLVTYSHQLEKDRDEQARQAVREERRRIARELHDQVAHHLGVVSLQTSAARRWLDHDPTRTETALASAEEAARAALQTMPVILQALRADGAAPELSPQPTLEAVEELVSRVTSGDVTVDVRVHGARRVLPSAVELTAYRVIQESLTNVVKHAGRAHVVVELRYGADHLDVEVLDDGRGAAATPSDIARLGLVGMRERVEMLNGTFAAGPRDGGGFAVRASLPVTG